ncbi:MAG: DUF3667 domain-containing protein [Candidatus Azobacteroides sp.]|nr:DUF3667 domain-containing protein [Candidatus Azobacteroides sp.]
MSHHGKLRENKSCENCGQFVEKRFCPECGQENVETRQPFHYLFIHFTEDFVHYDSRLWKTIRYLLFHPAKLTKEYLAGKRKRYVPPVSLYIFISFITFFIPAILPDTAEKEKEQTQEMITGTQDNNSNPEESAPKPQEPAAKKQVKNNKQEKTAKTTDKKSEDNDDEKSEDNNKKEKSVKETWEKIDKNKEKIQERIMHDFPKAIFVYMPIFAFWLWIFHNKKKWYYFDHGIYTLHYFSFVLLGSLLFILIRWIISFFQLRTIGWIHTGYVLFSITLFFYFIYYFFHSHRVIYKESKAISRLKCIFMFFINSFCMILFLLLYLVVEACITDHTIFTKIAKINW